MSREANVTRDDGVHRYEHKYIHISVDDGADTPRLCDLAALTDLRWLLLRQAGGATLLEKTLSAGITTADDDDDDTEEAAVIEIEVDDWADVPANVYYYELWDMDTPVLLAFGDFYLGEGTAPPEEE